MNIPEDLKKFHFDRLFTIAENINESLIKKAIIWDIN